MFELSFGEILLFTIVALIVLGPERLPALARFLGRWMAKIQNLVNNVKAEISAEIAVDDLKQMRDEFQASAQTIRDDLREQAAQLQQVKQDVDEIPYWDKLPPQKRPAVMISLFDWKKDMIPRPVMLASGSQAEKSNELLLREQS